MHHFQIKKIILNFTKTKHTHTGLNFFADLKPKSKIQDTKAYHLSHPPPTTPTTLLQRSPFMIFTIQNKLHVKWFKQDRRFQGDIVPIPMKISRVYEQMKKYWSTSFQGKNSVHVSQFPCAPH